MYTSFHVDQLLPNERAKSCSHTSWQIAQCGRSVHSHHHQCICIAWIESIVQHSNGETLADHLCGAKSTANNAGIQSKGAAPRYSSKCVASVLWLRRSCLKAGRRGGQSCRRAVRDWLCSCVADIRLWEVGGAELAAI